MQRYGFPSPLTVYANLYLPHLFKEMGGRFSVCLQDFNGSFSFLFLVNEYVMIQDSNKLIYSNGISQEAEILLRGFAVNIFHGYSSYSGKQGVYRTVREGN